MKIQNYIKLSPVFRILNAVKKIESALNQELKLHELNYLQSLVLVGIYQEETTNVILKDLAAHFPVTKAALSQSVSTLESLKLVARKSSADKRKTNISISKKGREVAIKIICMLEEKEQLFDKHVSNKFLEELEDFQKLLPPK